MGTHIPRTGVIWTSSLRSWADWASGFLSSSSWSLKGTCSTSQDMGNHGITTLAHPVTICDHGEAGEAEAFHCAVVFDLGAIPKKKAVLTPWMYDTMTTVTTSWEPTCSVSSTGSASQYDKIAESWLLNHKNGQIVQSHLDANRFTQLRTSQNPPWISVDAPLLVDQLYYVIHFKLRPKKHTPRTFYSKGVFILGQQHF